MWSAAFKYWARDGLVRQVGDNPVRFTLANLKQLTLTRAENPGTSCITKSLSGEAERILKRTLLPEETNLINDWVQVFELPEEVVLMLLQIEMETAGGEVSIKIADRREGMGAERHPHGGRRGEGRRHGQSARTAAPQAGWRVWVSAARRSEDEKTMYKTWIDEWGFTPEAVQEAHAADDEGNADHGVSQRHSDAPAPARAARGHRAGNGHAERSTARGLRPRGIRRSGRDGQNADAG